MLEKLYHPSDVIHVHYLREQTEAEKIEMDEQQSSQQHQQNSFNYRAGSIDENLFANGFLQREVPRDTLQKAKVEESKIVQEESKYETQETQGLDKSSLHSPIQINPSVADHYIRTKTTEVKISSHQSALANAVSKSVKFKIDPLINEEEEEKTKSILDKNTTSVIGRSPQKQGPPGTFFNAEASCIKLSHKIAPIKSLWDGLSSLNSRLKMTQDLNKNSKLDNLTKSFTRIQTTSDQKKEQISFEQVKRLVHEKVTSSNEKLRYQITMWKMNHGKMPLMLSSVEMRSEKEFEVFRNQIFYSQDGNWLFLIIIDSESQILEKVLFFESSRIEIPTCHSQVSIKHLNINVDALPSHIDPSILWGTPHFFWNEPEIKLFPHIQNRDEESDSDNLCKPYYLYLQTTTQGRFLKIQSSDVFNDAFTFDLVQDDQKIEHLIFGESTQSDDLMIFRMSSSNQQLTLLVTQMTGNNNSIRLYQTTVKEFKKSCQINFSNLEVKEFNHPVLSYNNNQYGGGNFSSNFKVWYNNSMETIIIENLNRDQFLHFPFQSTSIEEEGEAKLTTKQQDDNDFGNTFLMSSQKLNEDNEQYLQEDNASQIRFYFFLDRKTEQQVAVKTGRSIIMPKNQHTKPNINILMIDCRSMLSSHFTTSDLFQGAQNQPFEQLKNDQKIYEVNELIEGMIDFPRSSNAINDKMDISDNFFDYVPQVQQDKTRTYVINQVNHLKDIPFIRQEAKVQSLHYGIFDNHLCHRESRIDKQQFLYINPYIIEVTNNSTMTIISTHDLNKRHLLSLQNNFLCFAEMYGGSLSIGGTTFYQSSSVLYLTIEELCQRVSSVKRNGTVSSKRVCLNILELPQRFNCDENDQEIFNLYTFNKEKYSLDLRNLRHEKIVKCYIDVLDLPDSKKVDPLLVFIQYPDHLHIESFNSHYYNRRFTLNSDVPMVKFRENNKRNNQQQGPSSSQPLSSGSSNSQLQPWFLVVCRDEQGGQLMNDHIKKLIIEEDVPPSFESLIEFPNDQKIVSMGRSKDIFIVFDNKLRVQRIKFDNAGKTVEYKKMSELTPQAFIQWKRQQYLNSNIAITDNEVYFGHFFFQNYHNFQTQQDSNRMQLDFENKRNFKIPMMTYQNFILGPLKSLDQSNLMYVKLYEQEDPRLQGNSNALKGQRRQLITSVKGANSKSQSFKKLVSVDDESKNEQYLQEIFCLPFMGCKYINLIHHDDYLYENVKFSSFTVIDDILILMGGKTKRKLFIFDAFGKPLVLNINDKDKSIIEDGSILNITTSRERQFLLIELRDVFHIGHLTYDSKCVTGLQYSLKIPSKYQKYTHSQAGAAGQQNHQARLDQEGNLYQLIVGEISDLVSESNSYLMYKNEEVLPQLQQKINQILKQIRVQEQNPFEMNVVQTEEEGILNGPSQIEMTPRSEVKEQQIEMIVQKDNPKRKASNNNDDAKRFFDIEFIILQSKYLVIREAKEIYFMDLTDKSSEFARINLKLREGIINQMMQTQITHFLQFVYIQTQPTKTAYIFTWNLQTNMEESMIEIPINQGQNSGEGKKKIITQKEKDQVKILKGVSERLNYYIPGQIDGYYDLRYNFPTQFLNGQNASADLFKEQEGKQFLMTAQQARKMKKQKIISLFKGQKQIDELKFSSNSLRVLGLTKFCMAKIINSYSFLDLQYMQYITQNMDQDHLTSLQLEFMRFRLPTDGSNIIHILAQNERLLQIYLRSIKAAIQEQEFTKHQKSSSIPECFYNLIVYPNNNGDSPIDLAMNNSAYRAAEIMLDMLSQVQPKYNFSKYLQKHFLTFLDLNSLCFDQFLASCKVKLNIDCRRKYQWRYYQNQKQLAFHTSYLDEDFLNDHFAKPQQLAKDDVSDSEKNNLETQNIQCEGIIQIQAKTPQDQYEGFKYECQRKENLFMQSNNKSNEDDQDGNIETQSIKFEVIDFPWVFNGKSAQSFIKYLSNQEKGSKLFANPVIKHIILFQWGYFWRSYLYSRYIPFMFFFTTILFYVTLTHEFATQDDIIVSREYISDKDNNPWARPWDLAHLILGVLIIIQSCYFLILEIKKLLQAGFSNHLVMEIVFYLFALGLVIANFAGANDTQFRIIAVFLLMQCYLQFVMYLRLFDQTAVMVSMLFYITKDIMVFILVFFVGIIAFANMFYIMQGIAYNMGQVPSESKIVDENFALAILATFNAAFGNFDTDVFKKYGSHQWLLWVIYVSLVLILCLIMLNMIIALMGNTYAQVNAMQKEERMKAKCRLIHENEFIFARKTFFSNFRYIIVATVDRVTDNEVDGQKLMNEKIDQNHQELTTFIKTRSFVDQKLLDLFQINTELEAKIDEIMTKITKQQQTTESQEQNEKKTLSRQQVEVQFKRNIQEKLGLIVKQKTVSKEISSEAKKEVIKD